jgi:hypothetical protein
MAIYSSGLVFLLNISKQKRHEALINACTLTISTEDAKTEGRNRGLAETQNGQYLPGLGLFPKSHHFFRPA